MSKQPGVSSLGGTSADDPRGPWYFCLKHHQVETLDGCKALDRLGPYYSVADAELALERVAARNQEWDSGSEEDLD